MADNCCSCGEVIPVTDLYMTTPKGEYVCESCYVDLPNKMKEAIDLAQEKIKEATDLMQEKTKEATDLMQEAENVFKGKPLQLVTVTLWLLFRDTLRQAANGDKRRLTNLVDKWATKLKQ